MLLANFNRKEHLRHRAVSLRQHGFLVHWSCDSHFTVGYAPRAPVGWRDLSDLTATSIWFATLPIALPDNCVFRRGVEVDWLARLLSSKRPLFSVDVSVCLFVHVSATLMVNIAETKRFRASCPIGPLHSKVPTARRLVTSSMTSRESMTL